MRLVRELLAADADLGLASTDAAGRARRYLEVVSSGLGLRAGALFVYDAAGDRFRAAASTLPPAAVTLLADPEGRTSQLARRAAVERRAFVARRATDDPLVCALHEADGAVETIAVLPLADHGPVGVLVLAGNDVTLATEVVRTLNPALRLLGLLLAPHRGTMPADPAMRQRLEAIQIERDLQVKTIRSLEAQIADLESALTTAHAAPRSHLTVAQVESVAAETARAVEGLAVAAGAPLDLVATPTIVVLDVSTEWEGYAVRDHRIVVVPPGSTSVAQLGAEPPSRIIVNVAASGALASMLELRAHGVTTPVIGVSASGGGDRIVGLGLIDAVGHPATPEALVSAVERTAPRGARVFAAGRDAETLMKVRQALAKLGLSVSLARDTKQIDELLAMVRPQVIVIDLELPFGQGYELVMRMAATTPIPAMVLMLPAGDPAPLLLEKTRERLSAGLGMGVKQWLADLPVPQRARATTKPSAAVAPH